MTTKSDVGALEASGLIRLAAMEPELEYLFRHVLVQDAAYASLLKQERRELHRRVADVLLQVYPDRRGELAGVIAMHLAEAGEPVRAAPFFVEAGDHALARFANREARAFFDRAYDALPADAADAETSRLRLRAGVGSVRAGWHSTHRPDVMARLAELTPLAEALGDPRLATEVHFWSVFLRRFSGESPESSEELRRSVERLEQLGAEHGDPVAQAMPQALMGAGMVFGGHIRAGTEVLERMLPAIEASGDALTTALLNDVLTIAHARLGEFDAAERTAERADRLAEKGDPIARLDARLARAVIASERGELGDTVRLAGECAATAEELGATGCAIPSQYLLGDGRLRLGDALAAKARFERTLQLAASDPAAESAFTTLASAGLAAAVARLGEPGTPEGWEASLETARRLGDRFGEATILLRRATSLGGDDPAAAIASLESAVRIFEELETRPALSRALRAYAGALSRAGRDEEARAARARADALADELG
ncbi:MAG: hypothetical protein ACRDGT_11310, partial [Candidatus Limnocylindria bacterium]